MSQADRPSFPPLVVSSQPLLLPALQALSGAVVSFSALFFFCSPEPTANRQRIWTVIQVSGHILPLGRGYYKGDLYEEFYRGTSALRNYDFRLGNYLGYLDMYVSHAIHAREGSELACLRHAAEGPGDLGDKKESNHLIEVGREVGSRISLHMEGTRYYTEYTNRRLAANKQTNTKFTAGQMAQHMQKVQSPYHLTAPPLVAVQCAVPSNM